MIHLVPEDIDIHQRWQAEREFFDKKVTEQGVGADEGRAWLDLLGLNGTLSGQDVLECACGTGNLTLMLAQQARSVRSFDISSQSVSTTKARVESSGFGNVQMEVAAMEELPYKDASFDVIVGLFILHHVADLEQSIKEIFRVLRSGGRGMFYETSSVNPLLMFWRRHLAGRWGIPKLSTQDEHPLTRSDLETISSAFGGITRPSHPRFRFFGKLYFQLFRRFKMLKPIFEGLDNAIYRCFPSLRKYSYQVMITLIK